MESLAVIFGNALSLFELEQSGEVETSSCFGGI